MSMGAGQYPSERWSLDDLFPAIDAPEVEAAKGELSRRVEEFEGLRPKLVEGLDAAGFQEILAAYEGIIRLLSRLMGFASLRFAEDTQDQRAAAFRAEMQQQAAQIENRTLFFKHWWKSLDEEATRPLLDAAGDFRYWLESLRRERPYTLSEPEEKIINLKDVNGAQALVNLYTTITNRYVFKVELEGETRELNREQLSELYRHPDPGAREAAYRELYRVYEADAPVLGLIYQSIVRDEWSEKVEMRGFPKPISARNLANDIPDPVVDTLLQVCRENAALFQRYFQLKARWLGLDRLRRYDIYAPVAQAEKSYPYGEAVAMVLESYRRFDDGVGALAQRVFDERHIDSEVRPGKRSGAFCATVTPDLTPWVLQSYSGTPRNVVTMAHELGHAVHSLLADRHTALTQDASLPLAETASTFGQMLLVDYMLEHETDEQVRRDLLFHQMDDAYGTIMRQAYFALFEIEAHDRIRAGAAVDDLHTLFLENLREQFGDSLDLSEDHRFEWLAIPHFYFAPFYVYAYAFGQLLVLSLYQQYREQGEAFKPRYLEILAAGGSASPKAILEKAGIQMEQDDFWRGGFGVLEGQLAKLEAFTPEADG
ncbi:MAG TPA: M3 family oligoendopeptidase [Chloroflexi bacterium]|nr:M3 family oligoendopeptidase [Chloroflexota bacterium]